VHPRSHSSCGARCAASAGHRRAAPPHCDVLRPYGLDRLESAATAIEYAIIAGGLSIVIVAALALIKIDPALLTKIDPPC